MRETPISIQGYARMHKMSQFNVIKRINSGELKTVEKGGQVWIVLLEEAPTPPSILRRQEFDSKDEGIFKTLMQTCDYGTLSLTEEGAPYGVPVNFAWWNECIVFHGAKEGRKMRLIEANPQASFNVVKPYAFVPSYATHSTLACPATQFFASVIFHGTIRVLSDATEKAAALNALMAKHQPEGKHEPLSSQGHKAMLEKTAVFALLPNERTMKVKFGQNLPQSQREKIIETLRIRQGVLDEETIQIMQTLLTCKGK
ncbi:MAG: pyridoxamine 5'-phosphate oxidase family protein [Campylobacterales bacterium]|nr:pyridoxamine 5'-phosphate oxidase family protein [Campylobacterales bacterium]